MIVRRIITWLGLCLLGLAGPGLSGAAWGQNYTASTIGPAGFGNIASGPTGNTIFRAVSSSGTVTRQSGTGVRITTGTVRTLVTIRCSGNNTRCNNVIDISIGASTGPTGRVNTLSNFTITSGTANILTTPTTGNNISFTMSGFNTNQTRTFFVGYDFSIQGDNGAGASGNGAAAFSLLVSRNGSTNGTDFNGSGSVTATVFRGINISKTADLAFGRIVRPRTGTGTVAMTSGSNTVTAGTGAVALTGITTSRAIFSVTGEGGQLVNITAPASFDLTSGANTITVTANRSWNTTSNQVTLSSALGSAGSATLNVGGSFNLPSNQASGAYAGTYAVTVAYN